MSTVQSVFRGRDRPLRSVRRCDWNVANNSDWRRHATFPASPVKIKVLITCCIGYRKSTWAHLISSPILKSFKYFTIFIKHFGSYVYNKCTCNSTYFGWFTVTWRLPPPCALTRVRASRVLSEEQRKALITVGARQTKRQQRYSVRTANLICQISLVFKKPTTEQSKWTLNEFTN